MWGLRLPGEGLRVLIVTAALEAPPARKARVSPEAWIALAFFAVCLTWGLASRRFDDEGYLTFLGARMMAQAPLDALFFQKIHPTLSLVYAPFAAFGWHAFWVAHVAMSAAVVYFAGAVSRRWWGGGALVAALIVASSTLFLTSAATGLSNSSGVFFLALALFLHRDGSRFRVLAGLVAGAALWTRYEQAPYLLGLLVFDVARYRDVRFLLAFVAVPSAYWLAGAAYHGDVMWLVHYPPTLWIETAPSTIPEVHFDAAFLGTQLRRVFLASPLIWLPFTLAGFRSSDRRFRGLTALYVLTFALQEVLPLLGGYFNYDFAPRYVLNHLLVAALLSSSIVMRWQSGSNVGAFILAGLGASAIYAGLEEPLVLMGATALFLPAIFAVIPPHTVRPVAALTCVAALLIGFSSLMQPSRGPASDDLDGVLDYLEAEAGGADVFTNEHLIAPMLESRGASIDVGFLAGYDIIMELGALLHQEHRQAEAILAVLSDELYGGALWPCVFPRVIERGTLLVLRDDDRVESVYDVRAWVLASDEVATFDDAGITIHRMRSDTVVPVVPLADWMDPGTFCLPCPGACHVSE